MTTMAEPEWDQATRDLALALDDVVMCPHCGSPASICQDPANQDNWVAEDPIRCHATTARKLRQRSFTEENTLVPDALLFHVRLARRT